MKITAWERERAAAEMALRRLEQGMASARADLDAGEIPSGSLTEIVTDYDRALSKLTMLAELALNGEADRAEIIDRAARRQLPNQQPRETFCSVCGPLDEPGVHTQRDCPGWQEARDG